MTTTPTYTINTIVFSSDLSKAQKIAEKFTDGPTGALMMYSRGTEEYILRTFVRTPTKFSDLPVSGIVDVIIVHLSSTDAEEFKEAKKYLESRKSIPIKVLCSENALVDEAAALDCKYLHLSELLGEGKETVLKEAKKFEETLFNCFINSISMATA